MKLNLNNLNNYNRCPAFYSYMKNNLDKPIDSQLYIAQQVIKNAYLIATQTGFRCTWRRIVTQVDTMAFADVDINSEEHFNIAKKIAEHVLVFIDKWYQNIYLQENTMGYVNIPMRTQIGSVIIEDIIPIITLQETPVIIYINNVETTEGKLYNNLYVRGLLWLAYRNLSCENIIGRHLYIGSQGGLTKTEIEINYSGQQRLEKTLTDISKLISSQVYYPSRTEMCNQCAFNRRCKL